MHCRTSPYLSMCVCSVFVCMHVCQMFSVFVVFCLQRCSYQLSAVVKRKPAASLVVILFVALYSCFAGIATVNGLFGRWLAKEIQYNHHHHHHHHHHYFHYSTYKIVVDVLLVNQKWPELTSNKLQWQNMFLLCKKKKLMNEEGAFPFTAQFILEQHRFWSWRLLRSYQRLQHQRSLIHSHKTQSNLSSHAQSWRQLCIHIRICIWRSPQFCPFSHQMSHKAPSLHN